MMMMRRAIPVILMGALPGMAGADVLDDLRVTDQQLAAGITTPIHFTTGGQPTLLQGWKIDPARMAALETQAFSKPALVSIYESQGEFAKALESGDLPALAKVRLLLRMGRADEARGVIRDSRNRLLADPVPPADLLSRACRPLEDVQAWETLGAFLALVTGELDAPAWRAAVWAEELDVAWHLDRWRPLVDGSEPLRRAFFLDRLGEDDEREKLVAGLLENASTARVAEVLSYLPESRAARSAAHATWKRGDVSPEDRRALLSALLRMKSGEEFEGLFLAWLQDGGDAAPLADLLWSSWASRHGGGEVRSQLLRTLQQKHPEEPRYRLLLARQLTMEDRLQAAGLFESVAYLPLIAAADPGIKWFPYDWSYFTAEAAADLPYIALAGLGGLNRQDRVRAVLDAQAGWKALPVVDQVRYLAAGKMDFEGIKLLLEADYSKPENDQLGAWLKTWLESRLRERVLPAEVATAVAAGFDRVAAGSVGKETFQVASETSAILQVLGEQDVDPRIIKETVVRLRTTLEGRGKDWQKSVGGHLFGIVTRLPRLSGLVPLLVAPPQGDQKTFAAGFDAQSWLAAFSPPEIRRIRPLEGSFIGSRERMFGMKPGVPPVQQLDRWAVGFEGLSNLVGRPMTPDRQAILKTLMKSFPAGDPRRLPVDIFVGAGLLDPADEALVKEAKDTLAAVIAGQREPRGTEGFRSVLLAERGAGEKELRPVLEEVLRQPPAIREEFLQSVQEMQPPNMRLRELSRQVLVDAARPPVPAGASQWDSRDAEKLQAMEKKDTPEARALARKILDDAAARELDLSVSMQVHPAVSVLENAGEMDAWVKETREKLVKEGVREVDVLRRLRRLDQRYRSDGPPQGSVYAREILKLNPTDVAISRDLLSIAATEGDRELLLQCLRNLGAQALDMSAEAVLMSFGPGDAALVLSLMCPPEPGPRPPGPAGAWMLHRYLLAADPTLAAELRTRMMARGGFAPAARREIATQLVDAGKSGEAIETYARSFSVAPDYPGFPHAFPPKSGMVGESYLQNWNVEVYREDIAFLTKSKLLEQVLKRMEELGGIDKIARATFILATLPDRDGIETRVLPLIAQLDKTQRLLVIRGWSELFSKQPGASALVLWLLEEIPQEGESDASYQLVDLIHRAARLPGGERLIASTWARLVKATEQQDEQKKKQVQQSGQSLLKTMLESADGPTWQDYWTWRSADASPLEFVQAGPYAQSPGGFMEPDRLRQVLPRAFQEFQGKLDAKQARGWVLVALSTGDAALMNRIRELIPADLTDAIEFCDLARGDTRGISPLHGAVTGENGETLVWWNLVSVPATNQHGELPDIPRVPMPALDGKFQLNISAGARPDRLSIVQRLDAAPAAGHIRLKLTPDQRHVALLATDPASGVVRWMAPVDTRTDSGRALEDADLSGRGFQRQPWHGPGGLPAWKVRLSSEQVIDLREGDWDGLAPVTVSAWISGEGKLALRCLDAAGNELSTLDLIPWQTPLPVWQFCSIRTPEKNRLPAETVRLVLSATSHGHAEGPLDLAVSNVRFSFGVPAPLPEGFERLARVPGEPLDVALSPDAARLAISLSNGKLAIIDLASRQATVVPLAASAASSEDFRIISVMWRGADLMVLTTLGQLQHFNQATGKMELLLSIRKGAGRDLYADIQLSPDGKWLVWRASSTRHVLASVDGKVRRDLAIEGNVARFLFTEEGLRFYTYAGNPRFLKTADFAAGEPQVEGKVPLPKEEELHPAWKSRLLPGGPQPGRKGQSIFIPATREAIAIAADGTLYYVDRSGNVTKVTP
jgi:hypothetical protein